jgi:GPH family glycoside/pentoside/hexuronide:cation symporter
MKATIRNRTFLCLILIIFTLAMGFNFVGLFNYYISIYYLFGGDQYAAGALLGINGTVWAVTGLIAVFPLNWISPRIGKRKTLLLAIGLMCAAQLSKIVCYNPENPYLVVIPTVLLSMGMLMFFTLGASMVGDICDEDELNTGTRSEGSYYSVYWWFIKMGTAFASFVTGALLVATQFNETQSKQTAQLYGCYEVIVNDANTWATEGEPATAETAKEKIELWINQRFGDEKDLSLHTNPTERLNKLSEQLTQTLKLAAEFATSLEATVRSNPTDADHTNQLIQNINRITQRTESLQVKASDWVLTPEALHSEVQEILHDATVLSVQAPRTLLWLRIIEIGLPLVLSALSILLTLRYPLTEERCYEIKALLDARKNDEVTT